MARQVAEKKLRQSLEQTAQELARFYAEVSRIAEFDPERGQLKWDEKAIRKACKDARFDADFADAFVKHVAELASAGFVPAEEIPGSPSMKLHGVVPKSMLENFRR